MYDPNAVLDALVAYCKSRDDIMDASRLDKSDSPPAEMRLPYVGVRSARVRYPKVERGRTMEVGRILMLIYVEGASRSPGEAERRALTLFGKLFTGLEKNPLTDAALGAAALPRGVSHAGITERPTGSVPLVLTTSQRAIQAVTAYYEYQYALSL